MIELDELLTGTPSQKDVSQYFKEGEFFEEHYQIEAIKKYLRTPEQKQKLDIADLSIEDCLNGRFNSEQEKTVLGVFAEWNNKLGFKCFGF